MTFNFPRLELSPPQRLWLEEAYARSKKGDNVNPREMEIAMWGRVPKDFDPKTIDHRLLRGSYQPTLLGIWHVDPKSDLFENTDRVIRAVRDLLLAEPKREKFMAKEIAAATNIDPVEVARVFDIFSGIGSFWDSKGAGGSEQAYIGVNDLNTVKEYLSYDSLEETVQRAFSKFEPSQLISGGQNVIGSNDTHINIYTYEDSSAVERGRHEPHPVFRSRIAQVDLSLCFVLMPFREEWSDRVYRELIRKTVEDLGLQCLRADDLYGQIIIEDIWVKINQCAFVITDVTTLNPNVMYELGIVHTIAKPTILITQNVSKIPFDFTHHRHLEYADNVDGFARLTEQLRKAIREIYRESYPESLERLSI